MSEAVYLTIAGEHVLRAEVERLSRLLALERRVVGAAASRAAKAEQANRSLQLELDRCRREIACLRSGGAHGHR